MLPQEILTRPKQGFATPLVAWLRGPLQERTREALLGERLLDTGLFRRATIQRLLDQHHSGRSNHSRSLWALIQFEAFQRCVLGR